MQKSTWKKVAAYILSMAIILTMLPMISLKVSAASATSITLLSGQVQMVSDGDEITYWKNGKDQLGGSEDDYNAKYDPDTHTLTLRNLAQSLNGSKTMIYANGNLDIVLEGTNTIRENPVNENNFTKGIYVTNGSLTIRGKGSLNIINQLRNNKNLSFYNLYATKNITIQDGATVNLEGINKGGLAPNNHETLCAENGDVTISGKDTVVSVNNDFGPGINAGSTITVSDGATVTAYGTKGMQAQSMNIDEAGYADCNGVRCVYGSDASGVTEATLPDDLDQLLSSRYVRVAPKDTIDVKTLQELQDALTLTMNDTSETTTKINLLNDIDVTEALTIKNNSTPQNVTRNVIIRGESAGLMRGQSYEGAMFKLTEQNTPLTLKNITIDGQGNIGNCPEATESVILLESDTKPSRPMLTLGYGVILSHHKGTYTDNYYGAIQVGTNEHPYGFLEIQDGSSFEQNRGPSIYISKNGIVNMTGGRISDNLYTPDGMASSVYSYGTFNISGGRIINNYQGGVYSEGDIVISGDVKISGNKNFGGKVDNLYLANSDSQIRITGPLATTADIGVQSGATAGKDTITFASGDGYTITADDVARFTSNITDWNVEHNTASNTIELKKIKEALTADNFNFTPPTDLVYNKTAKEAVVAAKTGVDCGAVTVEYYDSNGTKTEPVAAGQYTVKIRVAENENYKAAENLTDPAWSFTITQKPLAVSVADTEVELGDTLPTLNVNVTGFADGESETTLTGFEKPTATPETTVDTTTIGKKNFTVKYSGGNATANYTFDLSNTTATANVTSSDTTAPVISGVEEGKTYCIEISKVTVTDTKLKEVTLNGEKQTVSNGKSEFAVPAKDGTQTIIAKDLAGNTAQITFTVNSGHTQGIVTDCTKDVKCTVCDTLIRKGQAAHTYGSYTYDDKGHWRECTNADCQVKESKEAHDCIYDKDATGHRKVCKKCAWTEAAMTSHTPGPAATEDTAQVCTECGYTITPPLGHIHKNHLTKVSAKPAACEQDGNKEYYQCSCGLMFADSTAASEVTQADIRIPQTGHQFATTYSHDGNNHWYACTNTGCSAVSGKEAHTPETDDGDCTTAVKCSVCDGTAIAAKQHDYGKTYQSNDKEHWQICKNAGCTHQTTKTKHTAGNWIVDTKATVEKEGSRHKECSTCGYVMKTESIAKLVQYKVIEGADETIISHKDESLTLRADGEYPKFISIEVDGKVVDSKYYTAWSGSTYVKFTKEFMDSLSVGHHTIQFNFTDGYATTNLTVAKEGTTQSTPANTDANVTSPKTGNEFRTTLWAGVLLVSLVGMCGVMTIKRKKSQNNR